jgi:hypothetical protein
MVYITEDAIHDGPPNPLGCTVPHCSRILLREQGFPAEFVQMLGDGGGEVFLYLTKEVHRGWRYCERYFDRK